MNGYPDPDATAEWLDARYVFPFCNGVLDVEGIVAQTLLGRFRTLAALNALLEHGHIQMVPPQHERDVEASTDEMADLIAALV